MATSQKTFRILPRITASGFIVCLAAYHGYRTIDDVIARIKTDPLCIYRTNLLLAIEHGMYWESLV